MGIDRKKLQDLPLLENPSANTTLWVSDPALAAPDRKLGVATLIELTKAGVKHSDLVLDDGANPHEAGINDLTDVATGTNVHGDLLKWNGTSWIGDSMQSTTNPIMDGDVAVGTSEKMARADHVHPSDTTKANLSGGADFVGNQEITGDLTVTGATQLNGTLDVTGNATVQSTPLADDSFRIANTSVVNDKIDSALLNRATIAFATSEAIKYAIVLG